MDEYNKYKVNELLELLEFLEKEERPSTYLFIRKMEIRKKAAKKLKVNVQDVIKLCTKNKIKEEQIRMRRHYYENRMKLSLDKIQIQINKLNEKTDKIINEKNEDIPI